MKDDLEYLEVEIPYRLLLDEKIVRDPRKMWEELGGVGLQEEGWIPMELLRYASRRSPVIRLCRNVRTQPVVSFYSPLLLEYGKVTL